MNKRFCSLFFLSHDTTTTSKTGLHTLYHRFALQTELSREYSALRYYYKPIRLYFEFATRYIVPSDIRPILLIGKMKGSLQEIISGQPFTTVVGYFRHLLITNHSSLHKNADQGGEHNFFVFQRFSPTSSDPSLAPFFPLLKHSTHSCLSS